MDWETHLEEKLIQKIENQNEMAEKEQKPLAKKRIFVQTPLSHSTLK